MSYINNPNKVLCVHFQITIPTYQLLAWSSFEEEGACPQMRKMLSWDFKSHVDEPEFEVSQGVLMNIPENKGVNPLINV